MKTERHVGILLDRIHITGTRRTTFCNLFSRNIVLTGVARVLFFSTQAARALHHAACCSCPALLRLRDARSRRRRGPDENLRESTCMAHAGRQTLSTWRIPPHWNTDKGMDRTVCGTTWVPTPSQRNDNVRSEAKACRCRTRVHLSAPLLLCVTGRLADR